MSRFDWDSEKETINVRSHGVTFEEAETVGDDPLARFLPDELHSASDPRLIMIGYSNLGALLIVIVSEGGPRPRIISARRATKRERHAYQARP